MPPRPSFRLALLLAVPLLAAGCLAPSGDRAGAGRRASCGVRAAMDARQPERFRETPPACALPAARDIAGACAVQDHVTSPGYRPPRYNAEGIAIDPQPLPDYAVSKLRCRYASPDRNEAVCRFALSRAGGGTAQVEAAFEHRFVQDHGPAHHLYGVGWFAKGRCLPAPAPAASPIESAAPPPSRES